MYADKITGSIDRALKETNRRKKKQIKYNETHNITPSTIKKNVTDVLAGVFEADTDISRITATIADNAKIGSNLKAHLKDLKEKMLKAAENLEFEEAAQIRDEVKRLEAVDLAIATNPMTRQSSLEAIASANSKRGRSTAGKRGTRIYKGNSVRKT